MSEEKAQQEITVSKEQVDSLWDSFWHRDRCGDFTFEYDDLLEWLREVGVKVVEKTSS